MLVICFVGAEASIGSEVAAEKFIRKKHKITEDNRYKANKNLSNDVYFGVQVDQASRNIL